MAHQAVQQAQRDINESCQHVIDIDLKSFFDQVDHAILLELVHRKVSCRLTMKLLRKFLRAPIQIKGKLLKRRKGVSQGFPLSPLLSNILLNELDTELKKRGHPRRPSTFDILNYFKLANVHGKLQAMDSWLRKRLAVLHLVPSVGRNARNVNEKT